MLSVLFITNNMPPLVDGVGDYTFNLAREFARHGHDVAVVCREDSRIKADYDDIKVFPVVRRWNKSAFKPIAGIIRQRQIEVVSLQYVPHGFHPKGLPFGLVGLVGRIRRTGVRLFTFCHEVSVFPERGNFRRTVLSMVMSEITRRVVQRSDFVATSIVCYWRMIERLSGGKKAVGLIPIASNVPECDADGGELMVLRSRVAGDCDYVVGFFGQRDLGTSLGALQVLAGRGFRVKALLIGKTMAEVAIPGVEVYRTGVLDIGEIGRYIAVSDLLVLPDSGRFGCSFKSGSLMAGLRSGVPVLTCKGLLTDDALCDGENIAFADFSDIDDLAEHMASLLLDAERREGLGRNARALAEGVSWQTTYSSYMDIISVSGNDGR